MPRASFSPGAPPSQTAAAVRPSVPARASVPASAGTTHRTSAPVPTEEPTLEPPPAAVLITGAAEQRGVPGGYTWQGGSESAPWLPAAALEPVTADRTIEVRIDGPVDHWTARVATVSDTAGAEAEPLAAGDGEISLPRPASGSWVIAVEATFAAEAGNAIYYWEVVVP
jgi:hypothetical protein